MLKRVSAIFWDLDGTLLDSESLHAEASSYANRVIVEESDLTVNEVMIDPTGMENQAVFELFFNTTVSCENQHLFRRWESLAINYVLERLSAEHRICQSLELFQSFRELGIPQIVVSNSTQELVTYALNQIGILKYCRRVFCRDMVVNGKPDPELYLNAIAAIGVSPDSCLAFEDSYFGITAAKLAKVNVVGVGEESAKHCPDLVMDFSGSDWFQQLIYYYSFN